MVIPRSCSISMLSSTWLVISRAVSPPVVWISRSDSVDLPWSMWATTLKFRMRSTGVLLIRAPLSRAGAVSQRARSAAFAPRSSQGVKALQ